MRMVIVVPLARSPYTTYLQTISMDSRQSRQIIGHTIAYQTCNQRRHGLIQAVGIVLKSWWM